MAAAHNSFRLQLRRTLSLSSTIISQTRLRQALPDSPSRPPSTIFSASTRRNFHSTTISSRSFNGFDKMEPNTILFQGCDYKHWLILMDFGKDPNRRPPPHHMVDIYVQTCAKVFGSVEEAKRRIYACSTTAYTGFQVEVDEDTSKKFETLPGVTFVLPDTYVDPVNKEYGGDKYINGEIIPRPPYVQYGRNFRVDNQGPRDSMPQQGYPPYKQQSSMPPETRSYKPQVPQQGFLQHQNSLAQENYQPVQYYGRNGQTDRVAPIPSGPHNPGVGRVVYQGGQRNFAPPQGNYNHDYSHGLGWMNNHPGNFRDYASSGQYRSDSGDYGCNHPQCQRGNFREDHSGYALPGQMGFPGGNRSNSPHPITGGYEQTRASSFEQSGNGQYGQGPTGNYGHRPGYGPHGDRYQSGQSDRVASMSSGPQNPGVGRDGYQDYDYSHRRGNHAAYAPSGQYHSHSGDYGYNHPECHRGYCPGDHGGYEPLGQMEFPGGNRRNSQPPIAGGYEPTGAGYFEESVNRRYGQGANEHQYCSDSRDYGYNHPQRQRGNVPGDHAVYAPLGQMEFLGGNWSNSKPLIAGGYEQTGAGYFEQSGNRLYPQGEYEHQYRGDSGDYGYNHPQRQRGYFPRDHGGYAPPGQMGFSGGNRSNSPPPITGGYEQAGAGSFEQSGNGQYGQGPNGNYGHRPGYGPHGESQRLLSTSNEQKNHSDSGDYGYNHPQCQSINFLGDHGGYAPQMGLLGGNRSTSPPLITGVYEQAGAGSIEQSGGGQYGLGANEHQYRIDSGDSRYNHPQHHKDNFPGDRQTGFAGVSRSNSPRPITSGYEQTGAGSFEQSGNRQYGQGPSEIYGDRPGYRPHGESQRLPPTSNDQKNPIEHRNYPPETGLNKGLAALRKVDMDSMDKDLGENYGHRPGDGSHGESQMLRPTSNEQNQGLDPSSKVEMDNMDKDIGEIYGHRPGYGPYAESQRLPPISNEQNQGQDPLSKVKMDNMDKDLVENYGHRPGYGPQAEHQRLPPTSDEQNQRGIKMRRAIANFLRRNEHKPPPNRRGRAEHDDMLSSEEQEEMMA